MCAWLLRIVLILDSGPAKGYTEALEHRLRETEATLLQLLSAVDTVTLNSAFREGSRSEIIRRRSDLKADKSELAAHWDQFPLCTAEDVANWANEQNIPLRPSFPRRFRRANEEFSGQFMASEADNAFHRVPGGLPNPPGSSTAEAVDGTAYLSNRNTTTHTSPDQSELESHDSNQEDSSFYISQEFKEQYLW